MALHIAHATCLSAVAQTNFTSTIAEQTGRPWLGFGYNQNPLDSDASGGDATPWSAEHWQLLTERMAAIRPGLVRVMLNQEYFNPDHVAGAYVWDSPKMQAVYQLFDWYKANHIPILTGPWTLVLANFGNGTVYDTDNTPWLTGFQSTEYAQICADLMYQLRVVKGYDNILYFTPQNEPKGIANFTYDMYDTCLDNLTSRFVAKGLPTTVITGPDAWDPFTWMAAQSSSDTIFTYENHAYASGDTVISGNLESILRGMYGAAIYQYDNAKPGILGEVGADGMDVDTWYAMDPIPADAPNTYWYGLNCFDYGLQAIRAGQSSALVWTLCNYYWKESGMWTWTTSNPAFGGTTLRPFFYTWSMLSRYFPSGMRMYRMTQPAGNSTRIAAGQQLNSDGSSHWTIGIVNQSSVDENITVQIPGWAGGTFDQFNYSQTSHGDGSSLALPSSVATTGSLQDSGIVVAVPARSCVLVTTLNRAAIPAVAAVSDPLDNLGVMETKSANISTSIVGTAMAVCLSDASDGSLIYHYPSPGGIAVNVIGADGVADGRIRIYSSADKVAWTLLPGTNSSPVYSGGGYWAASTYSNATSVPVGTNYLKIELVNDGAGWKTNVDDVVIYPGQYTLFDPLNDLTRCHSNNNVGLDNSQPWLTAGDAGRMYNNSADAATLVYNVHHFSDFKVNVFGYNGGGALNLYVSPDGVTWDPVATAASGQKPTMQNWHCFHYVPVAAIPAGMNFLKVEFPAGSSWMTQIGEVTIQNSRRVVVLEDKLLDAEGMFSQSNLSYLSSGSGPVLGSANLYAPANNTDNGVMVYRYPNAGSFDVKVFGGDSDANNKVLAYGSPDNVNWTQIPTVNSPPDESDGSYWVDSHYTPSGTIPGNTNFLKFVLVNNGTGWKTIANAVTIFPVKPVITSATSAAALMGGAFSYQITASSSPASYGASGLPSGLTVDSSTGVISGLPTAIGTYEVTISATNANGTGSAVLTITVAPFTAPLAPAGLTAVSGNARATLSWSASSGAASYSIKRSQIGGSAYVTIASGVSATNYDDDSVSNGTIYYYVVTAVNIAGESPDSTLASVMPAARVAVSAPWESVDVGSVGSAGSSDYAGGSAFVVQGAGSDINARSDSFQFLYGSTLTTSFSVIARVITPLTGSSKVGIMIRQNATATGTAVKMAAVILEPNGTGYQARFAYRSGTNSNITWSSPTTGLAVPQWLKITRAGNTSTGFVSSDGVNWGTALGSFTGTINSSTSYFGMVVCSRDTSRTAMATFDQVSAPGWTPPPVAPEGLTATALSATQIQLNWNAVSGATGYELSRSGSWSGNYTQIGTLQGTGYSDTGLSSGSGYYYMVRATSGSGSSGNSTVATATTPPAPPAAPGGFTATAGNGQVVLSWNAAAGATGYNLKRSTSSGDNHAIIVNNTPAVGYTDTGVTNGTAYYYVVSAINTVGEGPDSTQVTAQPQSPLISDPEIYLSSGIGISGSDVTVHFKASVAGHTYQLQSNESLDSGTWTNFGFARSGTGGDLVFVAPYDAVVPRRFYRFVIRR